MSAHVTQPLRQIPRSNRGCSASRGASRRRAGVHPHLESLEYRRLVSAASAIVHTNLVSDDTSVTPAQVEDSNLVNPWGLAAGPTSNWWIANQGTGTST